jgi:pantoate--beta-alanine ligase
MIDTITGLPDLRARIAAWKRDGLRVGFVPTMGNLHAGHHSLVSLARSRADRVVVSIFVNPTQFGPSEDYARYPRTPEADVRGLQEAGCDLLWQPTADTMYPLGIERAVQLRVPGISDVLEGAHRRGHFDGVCTVVAKLFSQVQPDVAAFGRKDYQQLEVIRHMVSDLSFPIELLAGQTLREDDGLAMSSRNQYLSTDERSVAPELYRTLQRMRDACVAGNAMHEVESAARSRLEAAGFVVDYAVVRTSGLEVAEPATEGPRVALAAARLGPTRLIDNLEFDLGA